MMKKERAIKIAYHCISITFIVIALLFSIFFFDNVAQRMLQSLKDLWTSIKFYAVNYVQAFGFAEGIEVHATVSEFPSDMTEVFPATWDGIKEFLAGFGKRLISWNNVKLYFEKTFTGFFYFCWILSLMLGPLIGIFAITYNKYQQVDNEHGTKTKELQSFLKFEDIFIYPPKRFIQGYLAFLKEDVVGIWYARGLKLIWLYNLNIITILFETLAWVLYVAFSMDWGNVFIQIAKLAVDSTVVLTFVPAPVWAYVILKQFDAHRREQAYEKLEANEEENKTFLKEHPENILATGEPRVGKTQAITDMTKSQETIFREVAREKSFERHMQFPYFPWNVLEQTIRNMRNSKPYFNIGFLREFIYNMERYFKGRCLIRVETQAWMFSKFKEWGYIGNDFIFGYEYERYGMEYDNGLKIVNIWESIRLYAEEFYIFTNPKPMSVSNYPIKFDIAFEDYGNYPIPYVDYFRATTREKEARRQFNHKYYMDMSRLGMKKDPHGKYNNNFELGAATIAEIGKERGNQNTRGGQKKEKPDECTQTNDLFEMDAKMKSHGTTIDYFTYFRIFSDEQRAMELLAALREIGSEVKICNKKDPKILLKGFAFEELLYNTATFIVKKIYDFMKLRHAAQTLLFYLVMRLYAPIYNHYIRVYNEFGSYDVDLKIMNLAQGETLSESASYRYHISLKKVRSDVYDTGYFGVFYDEKAKRSTAGGINQIPQWTSLRPTIKDLRDLGSHHYDQIFEHFEIDAGNV